MDAATVTSVCAVFTLVIAGIIAIRQGGIKGANNEWQFRELKSSNDRITASLLELTAAIKALELRGNTQDKTDDNHHFRIRELESDVTSEKRRLDAVNEELHKQGSVVRTHDIIIKRLDVARPPPKRKPAT